VLVRTLLTSLMNDVVIMMMMVVVASIVLRRQIRDDHNSTQSKCTVLMVMIMWTVNEKRHEVALWFKFRTIQLSRDVCKSNVLRHLPQQTGNRQLLLQ
jgi:hypothetical protein